MSFEITYNTESSCIKYYHSSDDSSDNSFAKKMDDLVQEIKYFLSQIEDRKVQMLKLADQKLKSDDLPTETFVTFSTHGLLEVDDEVVEIGSDWWSEVEEAKSPATDKLEELLELDWYLQSIEERRGPFSLKVPEGWDFHMDKLEWKKDSLYYDDEPICNDYNELLLLKTHNVIVLPFLHSVSDNIYIE